MTASLGFQLLLLAMAEVVTSEEIPPKGNLSQLHTYTLHLMGKRDTTKTAEKDQLQVLLLTQFVVENYMMDCHLLVITHPSFRFGTSNVNFDIPTMLQSFKLPIAYVEVQSPKITKISQKLLEPSGKQCVNYLIFVKDVALSTTLVGNHSQSKVMVVTSSSRWKIVEYLESEDAKGIVNLLVVATTGHGNIVIRRGEKTRSQKFLNLYTHDIFVDGTGGSQAQLITSWRGKKLARSVCLFPQKFKQGFHGRQFKVTSSDRPPFVIKKKCHLTEEANQSTKWDGIEIRLLQLLGQFLNYTIDIKEATPTNNVTGPAEVAAQGLEDNGAELATAGAYRVTNNSHRITYSTPHSVDCAAFVSRSSLALPRYRAILGPFHWNVWLALILTYVAGIFPLTFADKHSLKVLVDNPWEMESMFWYVFGTFTNCFTFKGKNSWSNTNKHATRMLIGWYWAFSIIVTACYTGSIISFVTLFNYPPRIDTVDQLVKENYRVGTMGNGGWSSWFNNSEHAPTKRLLRDIQIVDNINEGLNNVTNSFYLPLFRPYAFLAGRGELEFLIKNNFTLKNKKDILHITKECFVPFGVSLLYPKSAPYKDKFDEFILRAQQTGLMIKITNQMHWDLLRTADGRRMQPVPGKLREALAQDRRLSLDDTQGMFLLLGAGHLIAIAALLCEMSVHHKASGKSYKIWLWRPQILPSVINAILVLQSKILECYRSLNNPGPENSPIEDSGFFYKTFDSRVLNSQFHDNKNNKFQSEPIVKNHALGILPNFTSNHKSLRRSASCREIGMQDYQDFSQQHPPEAVRIHFGSVGSVLQLKHCHGILQYEYFHDRPQSN